MVGNSTGIRRVGAVLLVTAALSVTATLSACGGQSTTGSAAASRTPGQATSSPGPTGAPVAPRPSGTHTSPPLETATATAGLTTLKPVVVGSPATITPGVRVTVRKFQTLKVTAAVPGETSGPAVAFVVEVRNGSTTPVNLDGIAVTASYGAATPATPISSAPNNPLTGRLVAGSTAQGSYVFRVPAKDAGSVKIQVSADSATSVAVFHR
jgi:hypothetical protein